ncbi:PTS sugar transporter subunit IIA [Egicoccus sp. AB-alg2]|uniref:PTS sugar transporter subunit IIA n=1 Tax=Egicoccus sp. AB-alg2 TaxID=3242693 RepID=UPI00359E5F2B
MLEDLLTVDVIRTGVQVDDRAGAVRAAGELLRDAGACEPDYVQAMVDALDELGPYCVIAPGVALPHAKPEDGVVRTGISLVTLRDPVAFGHATNDPVRLVVALAPVDKEAHLAALQDLAVRLGDPDVVERVAGAQTPQAVLELLTS